MSTTFTQESRKFREAGASVLRQIALQRERFLQELGQRIAQRRAELRLTQEEAAARVGVTLRGYSRWERGEALPYPRNIEQLAEALETSPGFLLGDGGEPQPAKISERLSRIERRLDELVALLRDETVEELQEDEARLAEQAESSEQPSARTANGASKTAEGEQP